MKTIESGKDKIQKICDVLRKETIDPAKQDAEEIVENAHLQAEEIVKNAKAEAELVLAKAEAEINQKKKVFDASLSLACKQTLSELKQKIEENLFHEGLKNIIAKKVSEPKVIADLITTIINTIEKEGIDVDLSAYIPKAVSARSINELLISEIKEKLREKAVVLGDFDGGAKVKLHKQQITIDISDDALRDLIAEYVRKDFWDVIFKT